MTTNNVFGIDKSINTKSNNIYDYKGDLLLVENLVYDYNDRLIKQIVKTPNDTNIVTVECIYNDDGSVVVKAITNIEHRELKIWEYNANGDLLKANNYDATGEIRYNYDAKYDLNNNKTKVVKTWYNKDNTINNSYIYEYKYDNLDRNTEKLVYRNDKIKEKTNITYNINGGYIREETYYPNKEYFEDGSNGSIYKYVYDKNNNKLEENIIDEKGNTKINYKYNDKGNKTETKTYINDKLISQEEWIYGDDNEIIEYKKIKGNVLIKHFLKDLKTGNSKRRYINADNKNCYDIYENEYNTEGKLVKVFQYGQIEGFEKYPVLSRTYDNKGNIIKEIFFNEVYRDGKFVYDILFIEYEYDKYNNKIKKYQYSNHDDQFILDNIYHEYDNNGNLKKSIRLNFDEPNYSNNKSFYEQIFDEIIYIPSKEKNIEISPL